MSFLRQWGRFLLLGLGVLIIVAIAYSFFGRSSSDKPSLPLTDVLQRAQQGDVEKIEVTGNKLTIHMKDGSEFTSRKEDGSNIIDVLANDGVTVGGNNGVEVEVHARGGRIADIIFFSVAFLPVVAFATLLFAGAYWLFRRARTIKK